MAAWGRVPDHAPEAPLAALSRGELAIEHRPLRARRDVPRPRDPHGGRPRQRGATAPRTPSLDHRPARRVPKLLAPRVRPHARSRRDLAPALEPRPRAVSDRRGAPELEQAGSMAPDDDRVWLAQADLATRSGRLDEAGDWLTRCERAGPATPAVWRARLEWAQAAGQPEELMRAARHLPASSLPGGTVAGAVAWLAARSGDRRAEREALEKLVALEPDEHAGLERLADLAARGRRVRATRRAQTPQGGARRGARSLRDTGLPCRPGTARGAELARAAETLGRLVRCPRLVEAGGPPGSGRPGRRPQPRWLAWRRPSRQPRPAAGRSPTSSGRCRPRGEQRPRSPARLSVPTLHRRRRATRPRLHLR